MTVSLKNSGRRLHVFILAHETYCAALGACACTVEAGRVERRVAKSLTLATGVTSVELPDAVLAVPEVVRAIQRGELAVKRRVELAVGPVAARSSPVAPATTPVAEPPRVGHPRESGPVELNTEPDVSKEASRPLVSKKKRGEA